MSFQPDIFFAKGRVVSDTLTRFIHSNIIPPIKEKRAIIPDIYKELIIRFNNNFELQFRVYDDGVSYRFASNMPGEITILDEEASFNFEHGTAIYYPQVIKRTDADIFHTSFEEPYTKAILDSLSEDMFAFSPVLLQSEGLPKVLVTESDVNDYPGMDMEEISGYARKKGIGLILWTQALTIEKQMDQAFQQFKKWDIKIVMTDFIDRNDQVAINFLHRFAGECASNKFMCMIHGAPIPAGFSRTYPNMLARESVLGSEYNIWSSKANPQHDLMLPFIRMVAGPMDYEPGILQNATREQTAKMGFEKVIAQGTSMHQMAMFIVYESPLQLFSGNLSDAIREPELMELLGTIPTVWDETKILDAKLGKYVLEARRNGNDWYLAAMNDWTPQEFSVPLGFLNDGTYSIVSASDGINAAKNPQDYRLNKSEVTKEDWLKVKLAPGGGFIARIVKN